MYPDEEVDIKTDFSIFTKKVRDKLRNDNMGV